MAQGSLQGGGGPGGGDGARTGDAAAGATDKVPGRLHRVVVLVDENSNPFELGCATEVFGLHRPELGRDLYDFRLCAAGPRTRMRDGFFTLTGVGDLSAADTADTLIVPNRPDVDVPRRPAVLDAVRRAHARGARLVGLCSGAFTLAEAGVLEGRRATAPVATEIVSAFAGSNGYALDRSSGVFAVDCNTANSPARFELQMSTSSSRSSSPIVLSVPASELVIPLDSNDVSTASVCMFGIAPLGGSGSIGANMYLVGDSVLRSES